jgi:hypothetical protein
MTWRESGRDSRPHPEEALLQRRLEGWRHRALILRDAASRLLRVGLKTSL